MPAKGSAEWRGELRTGTGTFTAGDTISGGYTYKSRFEDGPGSNPEQLIAAAHASCFSMALSNLLATSGHPPDSVHTDATSLPPPEPTRNASPGTRVELMLPCRSTCAPPMHGARFAMGSSSRRSIRRPPPFFSPSSLSSSIRFGPWPSSSSFSASSRCVSIRARIFWSPAGPRWRARAWKSGRR